MLTAREAQVMAYEEAALHKQGSPAHSYWMGMAHGFGTMVGLGVGGFIHNDVFILPPYIPADKLELLK